jgi:hypothetical protein
MRVAFALVLAAFAACAAYGRPADVDDYRRQADELHQALAKAREPFSGLAPFAVARLSPYRYPEWFVMSFFHYSTGYLNDGTAREHWVVRLVRGENVRTRGHVSAPPVARWAWSDSCPELTRAVEAFALSPPVFSDGGAAAFAPDQIRISTWDADSVGLWARLETPDTGADRESTRMEISVEAVGSSSSVVGWIVGAREAIEGCLSKRSPTLPSLDRYDRPFEQEKPVDIFP